MTVRVLVGDWVDRLRTLREQSIQCVVTSPPYWGLRDYGTPGQLGLELDPRDYIDKLVTGFREVRRVLRNDGTLWLNMGDSYTDGGRGDDAGSALLGGRQNQLESRTSTVRQNIKPFGLGRKQLVGMPWRLAFALQDDGWILRSDIIWSKPNPMPESVTDRPTKAHEYLFLFSKRVRYFYDAGAIMEAVTGDAHTRGDGVNPKAKLPSGWATDTPGRAHESFSAAITALVAQKNKRSVWSVVPKPFKGAHFATFPPALVEPCILAGTSPRACELCGAPWRPKYGEPVPLDGRRSGNTQRAYRHQRGGPQSTTRRQAHSVPWAPNGKAIIDWRPTCECSLAVGSGRCVVLDPFGGAGTTSMVAESLGRDSILIELSQAYADMASGRQGLAVPVAMAAD